MPCSIRSISYWIGRYLGIPGTILILLSFGYSMRKRKLIRFGQPKRLLQLHEILAWLGVLMILVHAGIHVYAILPWLALIAMLINVASGMTGQYLLDRSRRSLGTKRETYSQRGVAAGEVEKEVFWDAVTVDRDEAMAGDPYPDHDGVRRPRARPYPQHPLLLAVAMNGKTIAYLVAANLAVLLVLALVYPHLMIAPGNLIEAHRALETDCFACHQPFIGSTPGQVHPMPQAGGYRPDHDQGRADRRRTEARRLSSGSDRAGLRRLP